MYLYYLFVSLALASSLLCILLLVVIVLYYVERVAFLYLFTPFHVPLVVMQYTPIYRLLLGLRGAAKCQGQLFPGMSFSEISKVNLVYSP